MGTKGCFKMKEGEPLKVKKSKTKSVHMHVDTSILVWAQTGPILKYGF